ncbi:iron complex transport system ATP-binding protein [Nicoletella semolina]|uniref:Iron complex transport system ATP-binding protein n=1 Tax=Nicoletella semolina TaxID=271160 RepID=A0A4R2NCQ8_9PAST|nr:heme ABC transporter ATP-binding protein [Nicoletella semolina]MDH2924167.1 heme ABC transporter ATP-binding protein [Nicoletella semolina]TCP18937.1 iron complex transport system ATP-binding protein [Nicoletella semolina]
MCKNFTHLDRLLESQNLCFSLNDRSILHNVSIKLFKGQFTTLIGPNGAGKSTLLRLLSGYLRPQTGRCLFNGKDIQQYDAHTLAKQRAVMRQHSQLNFPFSVEEVIKMGGYHRRKQEIAAHWQTIIKATDCTSLLNKAYRQLSGGEQQRVQLARALLQIWSEDMSGKLLFLDEPTSAFDLYHQQHCLRLMATLCQERGLSVCCVLHDLNLAALYSQQIVLLADQQVQEQGMVSEVLTEPNIQGWYKADLHLVAHQTVNRPQVQLQQ